MKRPHPSWFGCAALLGAVACGTHSNDASGAGPSTSGDAGAEPRAVASNVDAAATGGGCALAEAVAGKPPVDIVVAVDSSPSMQDDAQNVQANLNRLSDTLKKTGLDTRVVLIALHYEGPGNATKMCVPPPLGGATCGASNPPLFRHVVQTIESNNMLRVILSSYDHAQSPGAPWNDFLRRDALKVFVPVTDDDSTPGTNAWDGITASEFDTSLLGKGAGNFGTAANRRYVVYPIVGAPTFPSEAPKCGDNAMNTGAEYIDLAKRTQGKWFSICLTDFAPVFDDVAARVADRLACEVALPAAPAGQNLDPSRVNVALLPSAGGREAIPQDASKPCDGGADGWQYTAGNASVVLCGKTCERARSDLGAKITVELGCTTKIR